MRYRLARGTAEVHSLSDWLRLVAATPAVLWGPWLAGLLPRSIRARLPARRAERAWARLVARVLRIDLAIEGIENIEPDVTYVVVALHESAVDPLALLHLPLDLRFVARSEIFGWNHFGRYLRASRHIELHPEAGAPAYRSMVRQGRRAFADDDSVVVFPQGTQLGIETGFQRGAFHMARLAGKPILPVVLTGGHLVWERPFSATVRTGQRMGMRVLPALSAEDVATQEPDAVLADLQRRMKRHALDGSMPAPRRFDPDRDGLWPGYRYQIDPAFPELAERVGAALNRCPGGTTPPRSTSSSPPAGG